MNPSNDPKHEEIRDRLMDQALGEVLGHETPPDLSDKILAAVEKPQIVSPQRKEPVMAKSGRTMKWIMGSTAACLVVGVAVALMLPATQGRRAAARRAPSENAVRDVGTAPSDYGVAPTPVAPSEDEWVEDYVEFDKPLEDIEVSDLSPGLTISPKMEPPSIGWPIPSRPTGSVVSHAGGGQGPGQGGDKYSPLIDNTFHRVADDPLSTFSIDVDTASYANVRRCLFGDEERKPSLPPVDAVRIEEMINYFDYNYAGPVDDVPFAAHIAVGGCPWAPDHRLVRVGLKGKEILREDRPPSNLVFLVDVSGSMQSPDKLELVKEGLKMLAEEMRSVDRVAIVVYASAEGLVLPSTPGDQSRKIIDVLDRLTAGGSTNGGAGIERAYSIAEDNFIEGGVNRVLLCTDGDFNVGRTSTGDLNRLVQEKAKSGVFLSVFGFGRGNLNDAMMEKISNDGNGNYSYIDSEKEAHKVFVRQSGGTLVTIAKDVKIQVEFNPAQVGAYRLIGYANRLLDEKDFNDDTKDAGEIGAGHTVTALYEVVPAGVEINVPGVDPLKYQQPKEPVVEDDASEELLTVKLRYKQPDGETSKLLEFPVTDTGKSFGESDRDFQFAAAVASFGMLLRDSKYRGTATYDGVLEIAEAAKGSDPHGYRAELIEMVKSAKAIDGR